MAASASREKNFLGDLQGKGQFLQAHGVRQIVCGVVMKVCKVLFCALLASFLFTAPDAHALTALLHFSSGTGIGLYGDRLEEQGPDGFGEIDVSVSLSEQNSYASIVWGGVEYTGAYFVKPDKTCIVFPEPDNITIIALYKDGICGASSLRNSSVTLKPNMVMAPCTYKIVK